MNGFTLLELVVAIGLWMVLLLGASQLMMHTSRTAATIITRQEALEQARAAVDMLTVNVQMADALTLDPPEGGTLRRLSTRQIDHANQPRWFVFNYGNILYRLQYSNYNELASHLSDVRITLSYNRDIMYISVTTAAHLGTPITLTSAVDIRYKEWVP